jgi:hypothetical protein
MNKKEFERYYTDPQNPAAFAGYYNIIRELKSQNKVFDKEKIKQWIQSLDPYTLHHRVIKKFNGNKIISTGIDDLWHIDLIDMQQHAKLNNNNKYILTCIDVFSKFAWAIPIKSKSASAVYAAFQTIFTSEKKIKSVKQNVEKKFTNYRIPSRIQCDRGSEFLNAIIGSFFQRNSIHLYQTFSDKKACVVERFNRTLKEKMWRYFTFKKYKTNQIYKYIDVLPALVYSYNHSYHRTIRMKPCEVNLENESEVWLRMYGFKESCLRSKSQIMKLKFHVNDFVKIQRYKKTFEKGFTPTWTRETFRVCLVLLNNPPLYKIEAIDGKVIGSYNENDLQKVTLEEKDVIKWLNKKNRFTIFEKNMKLKHKGISDADILKSFNENQMSEDENLQEEYTEEYRKRLRE